MNNPDAPAPEEKSDPHQKSRPSRRTFGCLVAVVLMVFSLLWLPTRHSSQILKAVRKKETQAMAIATSNAIEQFYADYQKLPHPSGPKPEGGDRDTDTSPAHGFTAVLLGREKEESTPQNLRNMDFLEGVKPAKHMELGDVGWENGLIFDASTGSFGIVDPYGKPFRIRLDTNGDKLLDNPNLAQVAEGRPTLPKRVIVWSAGKDGDWNTWDDNPQSWD